MQYSEAGGNDKRFSLHQGQSDGWTSFNEPWPKRQSEFHKKIKKRTNVAIKMIEPINWIRLRKKKRKSFELNDETIEFNSLDRRNSSCCFNFFAFVYFSSKMDVNRDFDRKENSRGKSKENSKTKRKIFRKIFRKFVWLREPMEMKVGRIHPWQHDELIDYLTSPIQWKSWRIRVKQKWIFEKQKLFITGRFFSLVFRFS